MQYGFLSRCENLLKHLYVTGKGWFRAIAPDGEARECRHCWDIGMVLWCVGERLSETVQNEIVSFFDVMRQLPAIGS